LLFGYESAGIERIFKPNTVLERYFKELSEFYLRNYIFIQNGGEPQDGGFSIFTCFDNQYGFGSKKEYKNFSGIYINWRPFWVFPPF
jgi:hypothetical protein